MPLSSLPPKQKQSKVISFIQKTLNNINTFVGLIIFFSLLGIFIPFFRVMIVICFLAYIVEKWDLLKYVRKDK